MGRHHFTFGWILAGAAAFALVTTSVASAQTAKPAKPAAPAVAAQPAPPAQPQPPTPPARPGLRRGPGAGNGLNLSADQQAKIAALREAQQKDMQASREAVRTARQKFAELQQAGTFDEQAVRAAANAVAAAEADAMVSRARHRAQVFALLTPEQQTQMKQRQTRVRHEARMLAQREMRGFRNGYREGMMRGMRQQRQGRMDRGRRGGWMGGDWAPEPPVPPAPPVKK
jgi:Spy/CpxP family protein refolding chaperone